MRASTSIRPISTALAAALCALAAFMTACGKPAPAKPATPAAEQTYTVRGEVFELPDPAHPRTAFRVHHEAIDNWVGSAGKVIGMSAMTMEFEPGPGISLEGLKPGDKVEMVFEVWWEGQPPLRYPRHRITRLTRLPADTPLEFRAAKPPAELSLEGSFQAYQNEKTQRPAKCRAPGLVGVVGRDWRCLRVWNRAGIRVPAHVGTAPTRNVVAATSKIILARRRATSPIAKVWDRSSRETAYLRVGRTEHPIKPHD